MGFITDVLAARKNVWHGEPPEMISPAFPRHKVPFGLGRTRIQLVTEPNEAGDLNSDLPAFEGRLGVVERAHTATLLR
jgi:hypothetical protein